MSAPHRCSICRHRPGRRITVRNVVSGTKPRQKRKKPCACQCHEVKA